MATKHVELYLLGVCIHLPNFVLTTGLSAYGCISRTGRNKYPFKKSNSANFVAINGIVGITFSLLAYSYRIGHEVFPKVFAEFQIVGEWMPVWI